MADIVQTLKTRARILHKRVRAGDAAAFRRLKKNLRDFRKLDDPAIGARLQRRHCLTAVARECGFDSWSHAMHLLGGGGTGGFGAVLYPKRCGAHSNIWCASYDEAKAIRAEHGGYLLAYKHQFLVVDEHFIRTLGIDPKDPDLELINRDWAKPRQPAARARLYEKVIACSLEAPSGQYGAVWQS